MYVDSDRKGVEEDLAGIGKREILIRIYYVKYIKISTSIIEIKNINNFKISHKTSDVLYLTFHFCSLIFQCTIAFKRRKQC